MKHVDSESEPHSAVFVLCITSRERKDAILLRSSWTIIIEFGRHQSSATVVSFIYRRDWGRAEIVS